MAILVNSVSVPDRDFTITTYPEQPYAGQAFMVLVNGKGPHVSASPVEQDGIDQIFIEIDFGDSEAEFPVYPYATAFNGRTRHPNKGYGPRTGHAYKTPGSYTITVSSWMAQGSVKIQTHAITVLDPDDVVWNHDYYIDLTGSSVGMPAEGGAVEHILNWAEYVAVSHVPGEKVRWNFRAGTTHTLAMTTAGAAKRLRAALNYICTFGGSDNAILEVTAPTPNMSVQVFQMSNPDITSIVRDITFDGKYDINNGYFPQARVDAFTNSHGNCNQHFFHCNFINVENGTTFSNVEAEITPFVGMIGCNAVDCHNFGLIFSQECTYGIVRGCVARTPPNQKRGDGKTGTTANDFPDHGWVRMEQYEHISCEQNWLDQGGSWSGLGSDKFIQPVFRLHGHQNTAPGVACVMFNDTVGGSLVQHGNYGGAANGIGTTQLNRCLIVGNSHDFPLMWGLGVYTQGAGGVYMYSNVFFTPKGSVGWTSATKRMFVQNERENTTDDAVWELSNRLRHNTFVCDNDATEYPDIAGADVEEWVSDDVGASAWITSEYNMLSGDAFQNAGSLTPMAQIARGDQFRPITGTAAATLVNDVPPINFDRTRNTTGVSQKPNGAHGAAGSDASVTAPAWSSSPSIGLLTGHGTVVGVTDISGLSGEGQIILEYNWKVDGVYVADERRWLPVQYLENKVYPNVAGTQIGYTAGQVLTCDVTAVNRSGQRVTSTSNGVTV